MASILAVDDEEGNRELFEAILAPRGHTVRLAEDGPGALAAVREQPPDLIFLDLMMAGVSGLEICQQLKADPATARIPVIVVTALADLSTKEAALTVGADDFVTKPLSPSDVLARVDAMLRVRLVDHDLDRTLAYLHELGVARQAGSRADAAPHAADPPSAAPTPRLVLLVDDEALARKLYEDLLTEHGFQVTAAASGEEALALAAKVTFDVVVLDIVMPGMSGLEVLARLRETQPDCPVLMLTGYVTSQNAIAALKLGAFDFLVKGLDSALVVLAIHRALRHRRELQARDAAVSALQARLEAQADEEGGSSAAVGPSRPGEGRRPASGDSPHVKAEGRGYMKA